MLTIHQASDARNQDGPPRIGLAIAGGGPVGAVYELGALRALEESIKGLKLDELDTYVGVSAGAFIAASFANRISCTELCRIFMGVEHAELKFVPDRFLKPAYREYFKRAVSVPGILKDALVHAIAHPLDSGASGIINELGKALPSGIFDNESMHQFLEDSFVSAGRGNQFDDLDCQLFIVAVDLDNGAAVRFGSPENRNVTISKAVQASAALPGLYPPVEINGRFYVDGALRRTLHASVALDEGVDLLLGINPLVPFDAGDAPNLAASQLIDGGLPLIMSQTFRALIQSRMKVGFAKYRTSHAGADLLLLEPERDDEEVFFTNIFSYASRNALCEHAYQVTRIDLRNRADELDEMLECFEMAMDRDILQDHDRSLETSIDHALESHSRVSRKLAATLDELDEALSARS